MNKEDIKRVIVKLEPDKGMEYRIKEKILKRRCNKANTRPTMLMVARIAVFICLVFVGFNFVLKKFDTSSVILNPEDGVYLPKIELKKSKGGQADMMPLIVYQGRVYLRVDRIISSAGEIDLQGEKLGITNGNINERSKRDDYAAVEFSSTGGEGSNVYAVKGYDKSFRIMTYDTYDNEVFIYFYECSNGLTIKTGANFFDLLKMESNVKAAKYETYDSFYNGLKEYQELKEIVVLNSFVNELKNTIPCDYKSHDYLRDKIDEIKCIYVTLNDKMVVKLILYKEGYIGYKFANVFFKMNSQAFNDLWDQLA